MKYCDYNSFYSTNNNQIVQAVRYDGINKPKVKLECLNVSILLYSVGGICYEIKSQNSNKYSIYFNNDIIYDGQTVKGDWLIRFEDEIIISMSDDLFKILFKKYEPMFNVGDCIQHYEGGIYKILNIAIMESNVELYYVYKEMTSNTVLIKSIQEMEDGRFVLYSKEEK